MSKNDDLLSEAKEAFELSAERESDNRIAALDDLRFARLGEQWPPKVSEQRELDGRPCLVINRMPAFIRQVTGDARQNKPSIKVHPVDSIGDPETADVISSLIRAIEVQSKAPLAFDTALDFAVTMGFGYFGIDTEYADDDTFDLDIVIQRKANPFAIYGDPYSDGADSADWNNAFEVETLSKTEFQRRWKGADEVDWDDYARLNEPWMHGEKIQVAKWWTREETKRKIVMLSDANVIDAKVYAERKAEFDAYGLTVKGERETPSHKVKMHMMSGCEILESRDWAGKYIPLVPVYGEELNVEGKRYFRSLVRDAKDPQRMLNYWRTTATELVALAPKAPFIGKVGAFETDAGKWETANSASHAYIEYDGAEAPRRQPFAGVPAGALQEAINASDDMKAITGLYDAALGKQGPAESGVAIDSRKMESDTGTFHFIDNLSRAIEHGGKIILDLIPTVYSAERILRVIGKEGERLPPVTIGPQANPGQPQIDPKTGQPAQDDAGKPLNVGRIYSLTAGKYDLTVETGPSFSTRRKEAAAGMEAVMKAWPASAPVIAPRLAKNLDWPDADKIGLDFEKLQAQQEQQGGAQAEMAKVQAQSQAKMAELQANAQHQQQSLQVETQLQREKGQSEIQLKREQLTAEMGLKREQLQAELALKQQQMQWDAAHRATMSESTGTSPVKPGGEPG